MMLQELNGKTVAAVKMLPTIETALQTEQDVETLIVQFSDGTSLHVGAAEPKPGQDSVSLVIKTQ